MMRIASWNIKAGIYLSAVKDILEGIDADSVCLQEVDRFASRSHCLDVIQFLASQLSLHGAFVPAMTLGTECEHGIRAYGIGLLSRHPIISQTPLTYSKPNGDPRSPATEPRVALLATIKGPAGSYFIVNTHLAYGASTSALRALQLVELERALRGSPAFNEGIPAFVCGDFNEDCAVGVVAEFSARLNLTPVCLTPTYPISQNAAPSERIDNIFFLNSRCSGTGSRSNPSASDHALVFGDFWS
jgi:endonuclease/exonuclease/phosphatase family metal-dependent hydrolase